MLLPPCRAVCLFREMEEERLLKIAISRTVDPMRERGAEESVSEGDKGAEGVSASSGELGGDLGNGGVAVAPIHAWVHVYL